MKKVIQKKNTPELYLRIKEILESAKTTVARSVNTTQVIANWMVGREIVEEEQKGTSFENTIGYALRIQSANPFQNPRVQSLFRDPVAWTPGLLQLYVNYYDREKREVKALTVEAKDQKKS